MDVNLDSQKLKKFFKDHNLGVDVQTGYNGKRAVRYHLTFNGATRISHVTARTDDIALKLGVPHVRTVRDRGTFSIEVHKENNEPVVLFELLKNVNVKGVTGVLGVDMAGTRVNLRLDAPDTAHILIAGTTGSGKTELVRSYVASLMLLTNARYLFVDPKGTDFILFEGLPNLQLPHAKTSEIAISRLLWLVHEMEKRTKAQLTKPHLVFVIDELADMIQTGGVVVKDNLTRLLQRGRSAGISVIAATQKPTVDVIGSLTKANFPIRICGRVLSPIDSNVATGQTGLKCEKLLGKGDFLLVAPSVERRFQSAYLHKDLGEQFRSLVH